MKHTKKQLAVDYESLKQAVTSENTCWEIPDTFKSLKNQKIRNSWIHHYGEIPDGLQLLHHCDNGQCLNPSHLFLGSIADNMHDMQNKKHCGGWRHDKPGFKEGHQFSKSYRFSDDQAREIFKLRDERQSVRKIGAKFGCDKTVIVRFLKKHGRYFPLHDRSY